MKVGVVGLGKMGLSHLSMIHAHPDVTIEGIVDSTGYLLDVLGKYTECRTFSDMEKMMDAVDLDAIIIATPTRMHAPMVRSALARNIHVFCEKPLTLTSDESTALGALAVDRGLVTQVGYHNKFVGAFQEVRTLLDAKAIGRVTHVLAEAYGPVVLRPKGSTWRSRKSEGGGCLYDYAAHPVDLLTWYVGAPTGVGGTVLGSVFSDQTDDEVFTSLYFADGVSGQLSVNWSDESCRKMTTKVTIWGTGGRIHADRQECQAYIRESMDLLPGYQHGWNTKYTTELTEPPWFYLRGEEYSAQLDYFVQRVQARKTEGLNTFQSAAVTDRTLELMARDALAGPSTVDVPGTATQTPSRRPLRQLLRRNS